MKVLKLPSDERREVFIKAEEALNMAYGCYPEERGIKDYINMGFINLDKPPGPTSHEVASWIKKLFNVAKAGHGGTLEPL